MWLLVQHILSTFRTQRVNKIVFELKTIDSRAVVTLFCDNGERTEGVHLRVYVSQHYSSASHLMLHLLCRLQACCWVARWIGLLGSANGCSLHHEKVG
jgi:hypothetical protein